MDAWATIQAALSQGVALDEIERQGIACVAAWIADLEPLGALPEGISRLEVLQVVIEHSDPSGPFLLQERARLEGDYIECLFLAHRYDEGLERIDWALEDYAQVPEELADMLLQSANVREVQGDYADAVARISQAVSLVPSDPEPGTEAELTRVYAEIVRAKILVHVGVLDEAYRVLAAAQAGASPEVLEACRGIILTVRAELASARADHDWVIDNIGRALSLTDSQEIAAGDRPPFLLMLAHSTALRALERGRQVEQAREQLRNAIDEFGLGEPTTWRPWLTLCEIEIAESRIQSASQLLAQLDAWIVRSTEEPALAVRAQRASVHGRIALRSPEDHSRLEAARTLAAEALVDLLTAWESVPRRRGGIGFLQFDERRSLIATLAQLDVAVLGSSDGAKSAFERLLAVEAMGSLAEQVPPVSVGLERVSAHLVPPRGGLIAFLPSSSLSVALTLDEHGPRVWSIPASDAWSDAAMNLAFEMRPDLARSEGAEQRLAVRAVQLRDRLLPEDLDAHLGHWEEVVLVRADDLGWVPFEVLPLRGRADRPIGLELATSYLPSLRLGLGLHDRVAASRPPDKREDLSLVLLTVGPLEGQTKTLVPIPWRPSHAQQFEAPWRPGTLRLELDPERAIQRVLESGAEGVEFLIVIAHGVRDSDRELSQGFAFAEGAPVFAPQLEGLHSPRTTALVVCGANTGRTRKGDDLGSHLVAAFLAGGSSSVLSSKADLSFEASVELMERVSRGLAQGQPLARALFDARRSMAETARWRHPSFHSNLTVTGLGLERASPALISSGR